jgi:hypothetical protein
MLAGIEIPVRPRPVGGRDNDEVACLDAAFISEHSAVIARIPVPCFVYRTRRS